jgi:tetratricopeptide (TPR) repeat protein
VALNRRLGFTRVEADESYKKALEYYRKNEPDLDNAIDQMNKAIEALPGQPEYHAARGLMHYDDGHFDEARADFEAAIALFEYELLAQYGLGLLALRDGDYDSALAHLKKAYNVNPTRAETLYTLAVVHYHRRDLASAANLMKQAHDQFEAHKDKRKADAAKWLRVLGKIADRTAALLDSGKGG